MTKQEKTMEERFNELAEKLMESYKEYGDARARGELVFPPLASVIANCFLEIVQSQKTTLLEKIDREPSKYRMEIFIGDYVAGYNQAIDDIKNLITEI